MNCPRCGGTLTSAASLCPTCGHSLALFSDITSRDSGETRLGSSSDGGATRLRPSDGGETRLGSSDIGETRVAPSDGGETRLASSSSAGGETRLESPDVGETKLAGSTPAATKAGSVLQPGQAFGSRYHIIRELGVGGMGAVYQAWDEELGIAVAIKVIRPDAVADPTAAAELQRRFKRELLLARQVTHKNVVRIHDLGEIDGIKYITMSYVEGVELGVFLRTHGRLSVPPVMRIARDIVAGLVEAHKAGVVHRDLKPANIMIEKEGHALIMDFGIARSSGTPAPVTGLTPLPAALRQAAVTSDATRVGAIVGTVEYMAPEQARGEDVDQRADVYAFGLILYDMLAGRAHRAQHTESAIAELQSRMEQAPAPVKTALPEIPDPLDRLITKCLQPDRAMRYQTSEELAADLNRLDDNGVPIPGFRRFTPRMIAAGVVLVLLLVAGTWWLTWTPPPPKQHDPVTVVIADLQNSTGDPAFNHTLEPMVKRALEGAGFISAYERGGVQQTFGVRPGARFDEGAARELAVKEGLGAVLSGSIARSGSGYEVSLKALNTITGKEMTTASRYASSKDQVLAETTTLVTRIRKALGDETSDSAQMFAMKTLSTTSLAVVAQYGAALEAQSNGDYEGMIGPLQKAINLDPNFGLAYQGLAAASGNLGRLNDAQKYTNESLRHLGGVTERERLSIRGFYYYMARDYPQCVKEYSSLIAQYAADPIARNNRALCYSKLRNLREAVADMRQVVRTLPKRPRYRGNLALYAAYGGDFQTAEREASAVQEPTDLTTIALAFAQLGQGRLGDAAQTYEKLRATPPRGAAWSASGLADLALYEGRLSDAIRILDQGVPADLTAKFADRAARKLTAVAQVHLLRGEKAAAVEAAERALATSQTVPIRFLASRIFVEANLLPKARALVAPLASELAAEPQAYGKIVEGEAALKAGDPRQAIKILTDAGSLLDIWLVHFDLGRAYLQLKAFPQADSEFDRCIKRRGEALSLLLDEEPTYGYFPVVYYYQGQAREGLNIPGFADSYREYLKIRGKSSEDPLLPEIRRRVAGQ